MNGAECVCVCVCRNSNQKKIHGKIILNGKLYTTILYYILEKPSKLHANPSLHQIGACACANRFNTFITLRANYIFIYRTISWWDFFFCSFAFFLSLSLEHGLCLVPTEPVAVPIAFYILIAHSLGMLFGACMVAKW